MPTFKTKPAQKEKKEILKPVNNSPKTSNQEKKPELNNKQNTNMTAQKPVLKPINPQPKIEKKSKIKKGKKVFTVFLVILILILGTASGYGLTVFTNGQKTTAGSLKQEKGLKREVESHEITIGTKVGVADESTFKDQGEGKLEKGGIDGEGSHKLIRPGGDSQTIYLTSSVIDLDQFVGRNVKVWGETFSSQKAGWLMDVGKLEVLE